MTELAGLSSRKYKQRKETLFASEEWACEDLGFSRDDVQSDKYCVKFGRFKLKWMRELVKEAIWRKRSLVSYNTLLQYVKATVTLDNYLCADFGVGFPKSKLSRPCILGFLDHLESKSPATQNSYLACINELITCWQEWDLIPVRKKLIHRDDSKRTRIRHHPKALSPLVQSKLSVATKSLSPTIERMVIVMREVGLRIGELTRLKKQCLSQDPAGHWYMSRTNFKFRKEHTVPVSQTVVDAINLQLEETLRLESERALPNKQDYLFVHYWHKRLTPYSPRTVNQALSKMIRDERLTDELGIEAKISTHKFRHTVGTNLINAGLSQHFVQKYLGHKSPEMTARYAEIHDSTLQKAVFSATTKLVDIKGNLYEIGSVIESSVGPYNEDTPIEARWLQHHLSAQSLPNGICALPIRQSCPHANACLTCPSFRSDISFISVHKEQLSRCRGLIVGAERRNLTRQVELNQRVAVNLEKMIQSLENEDEKNA